MSTSPLMKTLKASCMLATTRPWKARISASPWGVKDRRWRAFFTASSIRLMSMMSPTCSRLVVKVRTST